MSQNSSYATECHIYVFKEGSSFRPASARSEVPCWQQQLECEWKTSKLRDIPSRILSQLASDNVLAQPNVHFSVGLLRTKFQAPNFPVYGNIVNKSIIYQWSKNVCREKVCGIKFIGQIWEIRTRYPLHTKKIACAYTRPLTSLGHQRGQSFLGRAQIF